MRSPVFGRETLGDSLFPRCVLLFLLFTDFNSRYILIIGGSQVAAALRCGETLLLALGDQLPVEQLEDSTKRAQSLARLEDAQGPARLSFVH